MKFAFLSQQTVILLSVVFATTESLADATTPASILRRRDGSSNHDVAVRGSSSSSSNTSTAAVRGRQLKGTKKSKKTTTSDPPEEDEHNVDSCSYQSKNFECDGPGTVAICYKHDDHYHNKCVDATHEDIYNKVPGSGKDNNLYKDKYELLNCGCCPTDVPADMVIRDNIMVTDATDGEYIEVKYPKSYDKDTYCDSISPVPTAVPSAKPSAVPSAAPTPTSPAPTVTPTSGPSPGPTAGPSPGPSMSASPSATPCDKLIIGPEISSTTIFGFACNDSACREHDTLESATNKCLELNSEVDLSEVTNPPMGGELPCMGITFETGGSKKYTLRSGPAVAASQSGERSYFAICGAAEEEEEEEEEGPPAEECVDLPGWYDQFDEDCSYYEANDSPGCPDEGDCVGCGPFAAITAKEACCYCQL